MYICRVLIGNKSDVDANQRQVPSNQAQKLADEWGIPYMETSAKTSYNNTECFDEIVREIRKLKEFQRKNLEIKKPKKFWCNVL